MKTVYKYTLEPNEKRMRIPGTILSVMEQRGNIVVYSLVDLDDMLEHEYDFLVLGTGLDVKSEIVAPYTFLGSVNMNEGMFMFHVFYKRVYKLSPR